MAIDPKYFEVKYGVEYKGLEPDYLIIDDPWEYIPMVRRENGVWEPETVEETTLRVKVWWNETDSVMWMKGWSEDYAANDRRTTERELSRDVTKALPPGLGKSGDQTE